MLNTAKFLLPCVSRIKMRFNFDVDYSDVSPDMPVCREANG